MFRYSSLLTRGTEVSEVHVDLIEVLPTTTPRSYSSRKTLSTSPTSPVGTCREVDTQETVRGKSEWTVTLVEVANEYVKEVRRPGTGRNGRRPGDELIGN